MTFIPFSQFQINPVYYNMMDKYRVDKVHVDIVQWSLVQCNKVK